MLTRFFPAALGLTAAIACAEAPPPAPPVPVAAAAAPAAVAPRTVHVQVLAFNDFHGNLAPPRGHDGVVVGASGEKIPAGGAVYLAAQIKRLRETNPNTVVVSAGDLTGASSLVSSLFDDEPTVLVMNELGLDFEGVGNHDFDHGLAALLRLQAGGPPVSNRAAGLARPPFGGAHFQYLAANVRGPDGKRVTAPYAIKALGGVKIAFVGMTLQATPSVTTPEAVKGLSFADEAETANALLPELRAQGVATTIILLHQGGFQDDHGTYDSCSGFSGDILPILKALDPAFRVIVSGHTHQAYNCLIDGRRVTSTNGYGRMVTVLDLTFTTNGGPAELTDVSAHNVPVTRDIAPDPDVAKLVADYQARAAPVTDRIVGYQRGTLTRSPETARSASCETPLGDLVADSQLAATRQAGAVLAMMNSSGLRADLVPPEGANAAPVRYAEAFDVQPFENHLVTVSLTGDDLHRLLEHQFGKDHPRVFAVSKGFSYRYTYDKATRTGTVDAASMKLDGKRVEPKQRYRVTVNSFLANGEVGALPGAGERTTGGLDVDAMVDYLQKQSSAAHPITPPAKLDRIVGNGCE